MRTEKVFRLGRLQIEGDLITFEPAESLSFEAERRDIITVGVQFAYVESTSDKEETRIRLTAHVDGQKPEAFEALLTDSIAHDDSRRGFVSVPLRVSGTGEHRGRFTLETSYGSGPWKPGPVSPLATDRAEGSFLLRVK